MWLKQFAANTLKCFCTSYREKSSHLLDEQKIKSSWLHLTFNIWIKPCDTQHVVNSNFCGCSSRQPSQKLSNQILSEKVVHFTVQFKKNYTSSSNTVFYHFDRLFCRTYFRSLNGFLYHILFCQVVRFHQSLYVHSPSSTQCFGTIC